MIGIDEAQFFDEGIVDVVERLANHGFRVIVAGLDQDFRRGTLWIRCQIMAGRRTSNEIAGRLPSVWFTCKSNTTPN